MSERREHPWVPELKRQLADKRIGRREFLRYATLLGVSTTSAYALIGKITGEPLMRQARAANLPTGGSINIGMGVQEVKHPHAFNWVQPSNIAGQVVSRLTYIDQENVTKPMLAESWEASDDLRTWTFKLRDVKWHDGRPLTADDVVWNVRHVLDPKTGSSSVGLMKSYMLEDVDTGKLDDDGNPVMTTQLWDANAIEKVDDRTVRFNLKVGQVALPEHLDHYTNAILDPEEGGEFGEGSNGTGAFRLVEHGVGVKAVLERVKDYGSYFDGGPYLDRVQFVDLGDDPSASLAALASRQVHGLYQVDIGQLEVLQSLPHVQIYEAQTAATSVVQMIITRKPFDHPKVRQAMRYGMDCKRVLEVAQRGYGLPAEHHFVCPIHPAYAPLPEMKRDPAKARQLLAEAGYPDGIDITFNCKKDPAWELSAVQEMTNQWRECGIRANINVMPKAQFWDVWDKFDMGFVEWAHRPLSFMVLSLGFRCGVPWNPTGFCDEEFDEVLNKAENSLEVEKRREYIKRAEIIMQERGPICQPVWRALVTGFDKQVQGYRMHPQYKFRCHEMAISA